MARRPTAPLAELELDPVDEVIREDRFNAAQELTDALDSLGGYSSGSIKGILFKVPKGGGKYETIETIFPPFDPDAIIEDLKERFGGGDYLLRIMEIGKPGVKKNINFSIAREKQSLIEKRDPMEPSGGVFAMMMQQQAESTRLMMQMQADAQRAREAQSAQQTTLIIGALTALAPVIMGGRDKTSELLAAVAAFQPKGGGANETLELMKNAKELFGGQGGEKEDTARDIVDNAVRMIGPVMRAGADLIGKRNAPAATFQGGDQSIDEPPALMIPPPVERIGGEPGSAAASGVKSKYRILDVVRDDVLYCYAKGHDPEKAADLVYDTIEEHGVTDQEINELVALFTVSSDPLHDLAAEGIELRGRPGWAQSFFAALVAIHSGGDTDGDDADTARDGGGAANPG